MGKTKRQFPCGRKIANRKHRSDRSEDNCPLSMVDCPL